MNEVGALLGFTFLTLLIGTPFAGIAFVLGPMLKRFHRVYWMVAILAYCGMMAVAVGGWMWLLDNDVIVRFRGPIYLGGRWILVGMTVIYWGCCTIYWFDTVRKIREKMGPKPSAGL